MSDLVFPSSMAGYTWDSKKKPVFNNIVHSAVTGRDIRLSLYNQPVFEFTLSNQWLSKTDKDGLIGFFLKMKGSFDTFLYADEDSAAVADPFGVADGVSTMFQIQKWTWDFQSIVNNLAGSPLIYKNGVLLTAGVHYTINSTGLVTVPSTTIDDVLSWTGSAYYRCVFLEDQLEYNQFADRLYDCSEIKFKGCMANKL